MVGVAGGRGISFLAPPPSDALTLLSRAIQSSDAKEDIQALNATENAISAVSKICKYLDPSLVPMKEILPLWLSWLPVTEDKEESPHVYSYLCDLIERYSVFREVGIGMYS